ncbi:hypothetical protein D3C72_2117510 [compost metagenome]
MGRDDQDLAMDASVPLRHRLVAEVERVSDDRLEVALQQPFIQQGHLRQGAPDVLRRVRHHPLDHQGAGRIGCVGHGSILSRSS